MDSQLKCVKGKSCGDSCISREYRCKEMLVESSDLVPALNAIMRNLWENAGKPTLDSFLGPLLPRDKEWEEKAKNSFRKIGFDPDMMQKAVEIITDPNNDDWEITSNRRRFDSVKQIINGYYKNNHGSEIGNKNKSIEKGRYELEQEVFQLDGKSYDEMPIYGIWNPKGMNPGGARYYGDIVLVMKPEIKKRATFTLFDSYNLIEDKDSPKNGFAAYRPQDPDNDIFSHAIRKDSMGTQTIRESYLQKVVSNTFKQSQHYTGNWYFEAQIHQDKKNRITREHIQEIRLPKEMENGEEHKWLNDKGVKVSFYDKPKGK